MKYVMYFFYVGWHWGLSLAFFIIRHEIRGEKRYGIQTIGIDDLSSHVPAEDRVHAAMYEPVNYYTAGWLFNQVRNDELNSSFLDAGCGKGRVLAIAAEKGFADIIGFDLSPKLYHDSVMTGREIEHRHPESSVSIDLADAQYYEVPDKVGVIFLFNPFDEVIMQGFIKQVMSSLRRRVRPLKILYANPTCKQLWLDAGFKEVASFQKMKILKGSVLTFTLSPSWNLL